MAFASGFVSALQTLQGSAGAQYESGTTAVTGTFNTIMALEDSVFSLLTASNWTGDATGSLPLPKGAIIYGTFTAFTLASGKVIAYNA